MDRSTLTPTQLRVVDDLMAWGRPRPTFDPNLAVELRDQLEAGLASVAETLGRREVFVSKRVLAQVQACEAHHLAEEERRFEWSVATARGVVAHKALELSVFLEGQPVPLDLVETAMARLADSDRRGSPAEFLRAASPVERAELRAEATDMVSKFLDTWPPLDRRWLPCLEQALYADLCDERIVLQAKVDLTLGRPVGTEGRRLVVDFKTGGVYPTHLDDLRYYALLDTFRTGVPPYRVASYYLDSGSFHAEDVTPDTLAAAVHRVAREVGKLVELLHRHRPPAVTPGPTCSYCQLRETCEGGRRWAAERAARGLGLDRE